MSQALSNEKKEKSEKKVTYKRWFFYVSKVIFKLICLIYPTRIAGKQNMHKKGQYIYSCNHLSAMDIPFITARSKGIKRFVGKKEHKDKTLSHLVFGSFGVIFIDRDKPEMSALREIFGYLNEDNGQLIVFAEGTRNKGDVRTMLPIKSGTALFSAKSGVPIVPFILYNRLRAFRMNYIYIGEEFTLPCAPGRFPSPSDLEKYTEINKYHLDRARILAEDYVTNKRWKKRNRLKYGEMPPALIEWEKSNAAPLCEAEKTDGANVSEENKQC